ncbi:TPA: hypothetical protein M5802_002506 [Morganella morganii]|uniref:hypothetical protein n=1 Tax=Morganella morganii TaxID=582 RepID=UPI00388DBC50|nr:hypothetical protein [Morganella morganii]
MQTATALMKQQAVLFTETEKHFVWFWEKASEREKATANAKLMAAAPDLLYSLQKLLAEYKFTRSQLNGDTEEDLVDVLCVRNAMIAINKALGRE